ncbi:hypothetical protein GCM10028797_04940 [Dyella agri]
MICIGRLRKGRRKLKPHLRLVPAPHPQSPAPVPTKSIQAGLSARVGRTPLIRLRYASELTGCEVLADAGTRYQAKLFNPAFLREKGIPVPAWLEQAFPTGAPIRPPHAEVAPRAFAKAL